MQGEENFKKIITNTLREMRQYSIRNGMLLKKRTFKKTTKSPQMQLNLSSYQLTIDCYKMF